MSFPYITLVLMSVVKIGPVCMSVDRRIVHVQMRMPTNMDPSEMLMGMMLVVESVPVIMLNLGMQVLVCMLFKH